MQLVSFDLSNNTGAIDVKMDWSDLEEKSSFKMLRFTFSSKFDLGSSGDNTYQDGGQHLILGAYFGLKPKIGLSYFLETKNYIYLVIR